MVGSFGVTPVFRPLDSNGAVLPGFRLYSYVAGTTTPQSIFADRALTTPLPNPAIGDSSGALTFWLDATRTYKLELRNTSDAVISGWPIDNIVPFNENPDPSNVVTPLNFNPLANDGVTDATSAINSALSAGKDVYFPAGLYIVSGTLTVTQAGQSIYGSGPGTIIRATTGNFNIFTVTSANNVGFRDLQIQGKATSDSTVQYGIFTAAGFPSSFLQVSRVVFTGENSTFGLNNGIKLDTGSNYAEINGCTIDRLWGTISGKGYGILCGASNGHTFSANNFIASAGRGRHGVYVSAASSFVKTIGNYFEGFWGAAYTEDCSVAQGVNLYNKIENNTFNGCCTGNSGDGAISLFRVNTGTVIRNNTINSPVYTGIHLDSQGELMRHITVEGNTVTFAGQWGVLVRGVDRPRLIGNTIHDSSQSSSGTFANIDIRPSTGGAPVACASPYLAANSTTSGGFARWAVRLDPSSPVTTNAVFKGNSFAPGTSGTLDFTVTSAATQPIIDGQIRFTSTSGAFTVTNPLGHGSSYTQNFTVYGAASSDRVTVTTDVGISGLIMSGFVASADTVTVGIYNGSGVNFTGGNIRVYITVFKELP